MRNVCGRKSEIGCALVFLVVSGVALAQDAPATPAIQARVETPAAATPTALAGPALKQPSTNRLEVSVAGGQLTIDAHDSTLADILTKVAALTGVKIDIPAGATTERLSVVKLGPGPARQVLASLLYGTDFDYLILASATDPNGIQNVLLAPRGKKDSRGDAEDRNAGRAHSPYTAVTHAPAESGQTSGFSTPVLDEAASTAGAGNSLTPDSNLQSQPVLTKAAAQMNRSGLTTEGALSPPTSLDRQSIEQQLQQMYQQRRQMMRVINPQATNSASPSPAKQ